MIEPAIANPRVPAFLRLVTIVECLVVFSAAAVLFFLPVQGREIWAWVMAPFNSRYVGAIYFAALLPLIVFAVSGRWAPGRLVLWMIFSFTLSIGAVMLFYVGTFKWDRWATWGFWFLYLFLPLNSAVFLYRLRGWPPAEAESHAEPWRAALLSIALVLGAYGVGLLVAPETVTAFWPWRVDAFHGRIYAATFITPAVGAWIIRPGSAPSERLTLGATLLTLGVLSIVAVVWTSATVPPERQVDYASAGTWAFMLMNLVTGIAGAWLVHSARSRDRAS